MKLRKTEVLMGQGETAAMACRQAGITPASRPRKGSNIKVFQGRSAHVAQVDMAEPGFGYSL